MATTTDSLRKPLWVISLAITLLSVLTTVNLFLLVGSEDITDEPGAEAEEKRESPVFVEVGPMTVNLQPDEYGERLLYAGLSLRVGDDTTQEQFITHMPEVHSRLLLLLSDQDPNKLERASGKEALKSEIMALFDDPLAEGWPAPKVHGVFFTDFIVQ